MDGFLEGFCAQFCAQVIFQGVWALTIVKIGNCIARHQGRIIEVAVRLQHLARLPRCIHVFSEGDGEIDEDAIKVCAGLLTWCSIVSFLVLVAMLLGGPGITHVLHMTLLLTAVNAPVCILVWIVLACSARRRRRRLRLVEWPAEEGQGDEEKGVVTEPKGDGAAAALVTYRSGPEQQKPLRWDNHELYLPIW